MKQTHLKTPNLVLLLDRKKLGQHLNRIECIQKFCPDIQNLYMRSILYRETNYYFSATSNHSRSYCIDNRQDNGPSMSTKQILILRLVPNYATYGSLDSLTECQTMTDTSVIILSKLFLSSFKVKTWLSWNSCLNMDPSSHYNIE